MKKFHIDDASLSRSGWCFRLVGNFLHFAGKAVVTSRNVDHFLRLGILLMNGYSRLSSLHVAIESEKLRLPYDSWAFVGPVIIVYSLVWPLSILHTHSILWIRHSHLLKLHFRRNKKVKRTSYSRGTQRQFLKNFCSEDDLRFRIFGTFVVKFLACLPLLGFSNISKME